jgi:hypothetical protein
MSDLEPNILNGQWFGWIRNNISKALSCQLGQCTMSTHVQTFRILGLLLIDYTQAKVDFVGLVKVWGHAHDLTESFLCVVQRAVTVIQYTNSVPKLWFL